METQSENIIKTDSHEHKKKKYDKTIGLWISNVLINLS